MSAQLNYDELAKKYDMVKYDPTISPQLIAIAHEYEKTVTSNNDKIFSGTMAIGGTDLKFPKNLQERLQAQNFAIAAKMKCVEKFGEMFGEENILYAITHYKP